MQYKNYFNKTHNVQIYSPGQDVKRYPSGVRLDNRKVLPTPGPRTKHSEDFFLSFYKFKPFSRHFYTIDGSRQLEKQILKRLYLKDCLNDIYF